MKQYTKPLLLANEDLAEGVYAASGSGKFTNWTVVSPVVDDYSTAGFNYAQFSCRPRTPDNFEPADFGAYCTLTLKFNQPISEATSTSHPCKVDGSNVVVTISLIDSRDALVVLDLKSDSLGTLAYTGYHYDEVSG